MKRYARKPSRATKKRPTSRVPRDRLNSPEDLSRRRRDPSWFGDPREHARAAKKGVRRKKEAKAVASSKSIRGWLTRYEREFQRLTKKKRPTEKDKSLLRTLRTKIKRSKASLVALSKRPPKPKAKKPGLKKPLSRPGKPGLKKPLSRKRRVPAKPGRIPAKPGEEKARRKAEQARIRRARIKAEKARALEVEKEKERERAKKRKELEEILAREKEEALERQRQERALKEAAKQVEEARILALEAEIRELREFRQTEIERRRRAAIQAAAILDELALIYGGRIPPEGEMIGIAQEVDLPVKEIYSIWYGSPTIYAA